MGAKKGWKILKETEGEFGGKWVEGEIAADLNPSQILKDSEFKWTWFVNNGELIKYDQMEDTFSNTIPADLVSSNNDELLVSEGNSLKVVLKN